MTAPIDSAPQLEPVREDGSGSPLPAIRGFPSDGSLERLRHYLAPLQRLGNQKVAWIGAALQPDPRETSGNAVSIVRDLAQRAGAGR